MSSPATTRGRPRLIRYQRDGRTELRWLVQILSDPRDPRSWIRWEKPTAAELAEVTA